ncbi:hypothetical protein [Brevibacterium casei]|uniref:hypothetical protein n=1 Tax=Brevibacterium casei TaxID=33889 RepID=UPI0028AE1A88|nr:hypothetical protein [Brevibacterium casei]
MDEIPEWIGKVPVVVGALAAVVAIVRGSYSLVSWRLSKSERPGSISTLRNQQSEVRLSTEAASALSPETRNFIDQRLLGIEHAVAQAYLRKSTRKRTALFYAVGFTGLVFILAFVVVGLPFGQFWYAYVYFGFVAVVGLFEFNARTNWNTRNEKRIFNLARQPYQSTQPPRIKSAFLWEVAYLSRRRRMKRIWGKRTRAQSGGIHGGSDSSGTILMRKRS